MDTFIRSLTQRSGLLIFQPITPINVLFFAWTKSRFDGKKTDFWNQAKQMGKIEHQEILGIKQGDDRVSFSVEHAFVVGRTDALRETWTVTVHRTPEDHFLFDLKSVQQCATDKPFVLEKYHYGGMAFRGRAEWLKGRRCRSRFCS